MTANRSGPLILIMFLLFVALCTVSNSTLAQVQGPVQMDEIRQAAERPGDRSRDGLEMVFGSVVRDPLAAGGGGGDQTMVSAVFRVINGLALISGVFLAGFIVLRKLFTLGNDGGLFQRGNDQAFSILRYVWGFAALVPTASGWSIAQLVVLWSASLIGVGTANLATDAALDNWYEGGSMVLEPARPETLSLAASVFDANLCAAGINHGIQEAINAGANLGSDSTIQTHTIENTGFVLADSERSFTCGGATYPRERADSQSYWGVTIETQPYRDAQMNALADMQGYISEQVESYSNAVFSRSSDRSVQVPSAALIIAAAARRYDQALGSLSTLSSNNAAAMRQGVVDAISQKGWWELGGWYQSMAQANAVATDNMMTRAQAVSQDLDGIGSVGSYYTRLRSYTDRQRSQVAQVASSSEGAEEGDATKETSQDTNKLISQVFGNSLGQRITRWMIGISESENGTVNPLISMKSLGDNIIGGTELALVGYVGVKAVVGGGDGWRESMAGRAFSVVTLGYGDAVIAGVKAALSAISPFIVIAIIMLFGFGITLSIYVPFIPFIIWFAAIINWVVFVAIGVVAAPLWAFAHLSGEDNGSRTQHGYIFMLNAMLRPVLMVAAFLLAGGIVVMGGTLLNELFGPALANAQTDSITGLVSIIGFLGIYISICLTLIHTSFNLIFMIPDKVMEWIGGSQLATGQGAEQEQQAAIKALGAYVRDSHYRGGKPDPTSPGGGGGGKNSITRR
ncbi:DotA/TraY family protein [Vreelandella alkaliphila]|uniref:DotA/TraY family protein n=1 Tax=Vreelandella alkaliphila TaxID=272774 RepID=UPI003FD8197C